MQKNGIKLVSLRISSLYMLGVFLLIASASVAYFLSIPIDDAAYVSADSIHYRTLSLDYCGDPLGPVLDVFHSRNIVDLNWSTIISIGALMCSFSSTYGDVLTLILNILILFLTLTIYGKMLSAFGLSPKCKINFFLIFLLQTFLVVSLCTLNKEVFGYLFIALSFYFFLENRRLSLVLIGIVFGLLKVQFFLVSLVLLAVLSGMRIKVILLAASLFLPLIYLYIDPSFLDAAGYYERYGYVIRTQNVSIILNEIASYPLGYFIVMPLRLAINMLSGFSPFRLFSLETVMDFAYQINALILAMSVLLLAWRVFVKKYILSNVLVSYMMSYAIVICILPFMQTRYFLPLFPILVIMILKERMGFNPKVPGGIFIGKRQRRSNVLL